MKVRFCFPTEEVQSLIRDYVCAELWPSGSKNVSTIVGPDGSIEVVFDQPNDPCVPPIEESESKS